MTISEVEIYLNQFKGFFNKNPNDLIDIIGELNKVKFYQEVKKQSIENYNNGEEVSLTHKQIIDIVIRLKKVENSLIEREKIQKFIVKTKFGGFSLN